MGEATLGGDGCSCPTWTGKGSFWDIPWKGGECHQNRLVTPLQTEACLKAVQAQNVGRLFLGGLVMGFQDIGGEGPQSSGAHLETSEGEGLSRAAHDIPMRRESQRVWRAK